MKVVILAGGLGTRISEESGLRPKPMIEIGEMPILWHIMKGFSAQGFNEFVICAGYKQHVIKEWFADYFLHTSDVTFDFTRGNELIVHNKQAEPWKVTVIDTGLATQTGGRVKRIKNYIGNETFILTYGDAVGNVDINALVNFHNNHGRLATISVYNFGQSKGVLDIEDNGKVKSFREKLDKDGDLINIGFMVLDARVIERIHDDMVIFEQEPLNSLVKDEELMAYVHTGYWQCMDTLREKNKLEHLWSSGMAPWKIWED
jgi:glucose-1-phosphate cytidylyltransferase